MVNGYAAFLEPSLDTTPVQPIAGNNFTVNTRFGPANPNSAAFLLVSEPGGPYVVWGNGTTNSQGDWNISKFLPAGIGNLLNLTDFLSGDK